MGSKLSFRYKPLANADEFIELEDYSASPSTFTSSSELAFHCQKLIILGYPLEAFNLIKSASIDTSSLYLPFHIQEFIELITKKKSLEALIFAQKAFPAYKNASFSINYHSKPLEISVNDIMGLLCYEQPEASPLGYLLDPVIRTSLASLAESVINPKGKGKNICGKICCCKRKNRYQDKSVN